MNTPRTVSLFLFSVSLLAPLLAGCWTVEHPVPLRICAGYFSPGGIDRADWSGLFGLSTRTGEQARGVLLASRNLVLLSDEMDRQLAASCNELAKELGGGEGKDAKSACRNASQAILDNRKKMGSNLGVSIDFSPPQCPLFADEIAVCTRQCEALAMHGEGEALREGCKVSCEAQSFRRLECPPIRVDIRMTGVTNAQAQARFESAIKNHLGGILKIAVGVKAPLEETVRSAQEILHRTETNLKTEGGEIWKELERRDCFSIPFARMYAGTVDISARLQLAGHVVNALIDPPRTGAAPDL